MQQTDSVGETACRTKAGANPEIARSVDAILRRWADRRIDDREARRQLAVIAALAETGMRFRRARVSGDEVRLTACTDAQARRWAEALGAFWPVRALAPCAAPVYAPGRTPRIAGYDAAWAVTAALPPERGS